MNWKWGVSAVVVLVVLAVFVKVCLRMYNSGQNSSTAGNTDYKLKLATSGANDAKKLNVGKST